MWPCITGLRGELLGGNGEVVRYCKGGREIIKAIFLSNSLGKTMRSRACLVQDSPVTSLLHVSACKERMKGAEAVPEGRTGVYSKPWHSFE